MPLRDLKARKPVSTRYLNAPNFEGFVVDKIKERILTAETITEVVTLVAEDQ